MSAELILGLVIGYFLILSTIAYFTSRNANNATFFNANKSSPWYLVAFGMIGTSLSGVTMISIPGLVGAGGHNQAFSYMQMVLGYLVGYAVISQVLLPLYYTWNLTSIYAYLEERLGPASHKTASGFFLISRSIGASLRLYLVAIVLQKFVMDSFGIPFFVTVVLTIALIWLYTFKGGIKTIVWTDTLQTAAMLIAVIGTIIIILQQLDMSMLEMWNTISDKGYNKAFFLEDGWNNSNNFVKQFLGGALIAMTMTGLDQDMMQKNLTCRTLPDAQKNMFSFSAILVVANLLFLTLGAILYIYAESSSILIPERTDQLYPMLALQHLPPTIGILFMLGLIAAAYSSADSALTSLTTAFCIDFLNFEKSPLDERAKNRLRLGVHIAFSIIIIFIILYVNSIDKSAIINKLFRAANFTYGPLLGLFTFSILTKRKLRWLNAKWKDIAVVLCAIAAILFSYILDVNSKAWFNGFSFGYLTLAINGLIMFFGLYLISYKPKQ